MGFTNFFTQFSNAQKSHVQMEFNAITPSMYIGTNMCCTTHYKLALIDKGVLHDVSLEGEAIDAPFGVETFLWLPTEDHSAPTQQDLILGVHHINAILDQKGKIYVHCKNGHGRAPTLVSAWFISQGMTTDEAVKKVQDKRKEAHIERVQITALRQFEKGMIKKKSVRYS